MDQISTKKIYRERNTYHFSQLTPVFQRTTENFSFPELISLALAPS